MAHSSTTDTHGCDVSHYMLNASGDPGTKCSPSLLGEGCGSQSEPTSRENLTGMSTANSSESSLANMSDDTLDMDTVEHSEHETAIEHVDEWTNSEMTNRAFQEYDLESDGRLTYDEFKLWLEENPLALQVTHTLTHTHPYTYAQPVPAHV